jgi:hypothetical protein
LPAIVPGHLLFRGSTVAGVLFMSWQIKLYEQALKERDQWRELFMAVVTRPDLLMLVKWAVKAEGKEREEVIETIKRKAIR